MNKRGITWSVIVPGLESDVFSFSTETDGYYSDDSGFHKTTDGGLTWNLECPDIDFISISFP